MCDMHVYTRTLISIKFGGTAKTFVCTFFDPRRLFPCAICAFGAHAETLAQAVGIALNYNNNNNSGTMQLIEKV